MTDPFYRAIAAVSPSLPPSEVAAWSAALAGPCADAKIDTPRRIAMFVGQCAVESGYFRMIIEDLDYSAARLSQEWPTRFPTPASAARFAHDPERLGNHVYAGRNGNGDEASGDGWLFRGRGLLQTTGRANYTALASAWKMDMVDVLTLLETKAGAARSACYYWTVRGVNAAADEWDVLRSTRAINGYSSGLAGRIGACRSALVVLSQAPPPACHAPQPPACHVPQPPAGTGDDGPSADDLNLRQLQKDGLS